MPLGPYNILCLTEIWMPLPLMLWFDASYVYASYIYQKLCDFQCLKFKCLTYRIDYEIFSASNLVPQLQDI